MIAIRIAIAVGVLKQEQPVEFRSLSLSSCGMLNGESEQRATLFHFQRHRFRDQVRQQPELVGVADQQSVMSNASETLSWM